MNKILVPIDGSDNSLRAAEVAAELVEHNPAGEVVLVHVDTFKTMVESILGEEAPMEFKHITDAKVENALKHSQSIFTDRDIKVRTELLEDEDIARAITLFAAKNGIELIVMGSGGLGAVERIVMGSVSYKVISTAHCPVTLVK